MHVFSKYIPIESVKFPFLYLITSFEPCLASLVAKCEQFHYVLDFLDGN